MVDMAVIFGATDKERAEQDMLDALNLEISLVNVSFHILLVVPILIQFKEFVYTKCN